MLPYHAVDELGCVVIDATNVGPGAMYPARLLSVCSPDGRPPLMVRRSIGAANDGGRWVFYTSGEPFEFEDLGAYTRRRKADRFTGEMLHEYLRQLGVPIDDEPDWQNALLVGPVS